jgi:hypothetical protein
MILAGKKTEKWIWKCSTPGELIMLKRSARILARVERAEQAERDVAAAIVIEAPVVAAEPAPKRVKRSKQAAVVAAPPPPTLEPPKPKLEPEKRIRPFVPKISTAVADRLSRAFTHRLYLISRIPGENALERQYRVLGDSGNVYTVTIGRLPRCDCPDGAKGNHCKHIIFVLVRVLKVHRSSELIYQRALLGAELQEIFGVADAAASSEVFAPDSVRRAFESLSSKSSSSKDGTPAADEAPYGVVRKTYVGEECAICFDEMTESSPTSWCQMSCGKSLHKDCIDRLLAHSSRSGQSASCPLCRGSWPSAAASRSVTTTSSGYVNLAHVSSEHRVQQPYVPEWQRRYRSSYWGWD